MLVAVTCLAALGFMGNQMLRQRGADEAARAFSQRALAAIDATKKAAVCDAAIAVAREFKTGSVEDLNRIERGLSDCGLTLAAIR